MARLTWAQKGIWAALMALAGELDVRNGDGSENGELDTVENTAWRIRCALPELSEALTVFTEQSMIETVDGLLYITNYGKRQARPPSARPEAVKKRVANHRSRVRNEPVTTTKQNVTPLDSDTDSDTEPEEEENTAPAPRPRASSGKNAVRKALEVYFIRKTKLPRPLMKTAKQKKAAGERWWQPLRRIAELAEQDLARGTGLIDAALQRLDGLTISAPQSILKTVEAIVGEQARGGAPPISIEDEWLAEHGE